LADTTELVGLVSPDASATESPGLRARFHLLMGDDFRANGLNQLRNLEKIGSP